jgi:hypothetical protein
LSQQLIDGERDRRGDDLSPGGRALRRAAAVVALVVGMAGGLSASVPGSAVTSQPHVRAVPPLYGLVYVVSESDQRIDTAKRTLIAACMASHGLTYAPYVENVTGDRALAELRPFGLETLNGVTTDPPPPEPVHDEEYSRALFGDPDQQVVARGARLELSAPATGCIAEAEYRLLGADRVHGTEIRLKLYDGERDTREQLDNDKAFIAANSRWRACMNRAGIDAPSPTELLHALPSDTDIATHPATSADVGCKRETDYLTTAYARLAALQQAWMDTHRDVVTEWIELRHRQDVVAQQVLGQN